MFYIFPRIISKKECEKFLDYCIKNTEFKEAQVSLDTKKTQLVQANIEELG